MPTTNWTQLDSEWPEQIPHRGEFSVNVYHFLPRGGKAPDSELTLILGPGQRSVVPPDTKIDSRYDLKLWPCENSWNGRPSLRSWMRIRTVSEWDWI